jgi:RNA polymerase sigma factor for flagellar operon FliA
MEADPTTLWQAFQEGDESARNLIVERHLPLVHHIARQVQRKVGGYIGIDDLVNAGCIGLLSAVDSFDTSRGLAFSTYAVPRIRGAILDDLRRLDHASRSVRQRQRAVTIAERQLSGNLDRKPADREMAKHLDVDVETLWKWKAEVRETNRVSLDRQVEGSDGAGPTIGDLIAGSSGTEVEDDITRQEERRVLEAEVRKLPERERIVLMLYYHDELKLRQIAEVLGLTESRVSQIRSKAIRTLRGCMGRLREGES